MTFEVGSLVTWASQSAGIVKRKTGTVEAIIPAGKRPELKGAGLSRDHVSYVVRVREIDDHGRKRSKLYWPRVEGLDTAEAT